MTIEMVINVFRGKSQHDQTPILDKAYDLMDGIMSKKECIAIAMGYENTAGLHNTWTKK